MRAASWIAFFPVTGSFPLWSQGVVRLPDPPPLNLPDWLAPFPQADDATERASSIEVTSSYGAPAALAAIVAHYERQLRTAGIAFETKPEDSGASVE